MHFFLDGLGFGVQRLDPIGKPAQFGHKIRGVFSGLLAAGYFGGFCIAAVFQAFHLGQRGAAALVHFQKFIHGNFGIAGLERGGHGFRFFLQKLEIEHDSFLGKGWSERKIRCVVKFSARSCSFCVAPGGAGVNKRNARNLPLIREPCPFSLCVHYGKCRVSRRLSFRGRA